MYAKNILSTMFACVFALCPAAALAETIHVPPVVVSELVHEHFTMKFPMSTITRDMVTFPCEPDECSGPGFSAAVGPGDTIITRIEAPAGYKFVVTHPQDANLYFSSNPYWHTGAGDSTSFGEVAVITFENLVGVEPAPTYDFNAVSNNGEVVHATNDFLVVDDFEFTALIVQFTVTHSVPNISRNYNSVTSSSAPSFGCARSGFNQSLPDATLMQIVPIQPSDPVEVPTVVVNELQHAHFIVGMMNQQTITRDTVTFPCSAGACDGPGFSASIGTGDTILTRIVAPPGHKFVVTRAPGGSQFFFSRPYWHTGVSDVISNSAQPIITFENLVGVAPISTYNLNYVSDNGEAVGMQNDFSVGGDFEFTAMQVQFTIAHPVTDIPRSYGNVTSSSSLSFGTSHNIPGTAPDMTLMAIVPIGTPCPADIAMPQDNNVNVSDLFILLANWNTNGPGANLAPPLDIVNVSDLFALLAAWGDC